MKVPAGIRLALESSGLSWRVEPGKKHNKLLVEGKQIAVMSRETNSGGPRGQRNILAAIGRKRKESQNERT